MCFVQKQLRARFAMESCRQALIDFEIRYPVSFALELEHHVEERQTTTPSDTNPAAAKANKGMWKNSYRPAAGQFAAPQPGIAERFGTSRAARGNVNSRRPSGVTTGASSGSSRASERRETKRRKSEADAAATNITDEADSLKKIRRQAHYRECSRHFIRYFADAGIIRLHLTMHLTIGLTAVMLVLGLGLGLKAKFCGLGLGLATGWPWPWP